MMDYRSVMPSPTDDSDTSPSLNASTTSERPYFWYLLLITKSTLSETTSPMIGLVLND